MKTLDICNHKMRCFRVILIENGEKYGFNDCLTHDKADPLVEFSDLTYKDAKGFGSNGQFVARYYRSTLLGIDPLFPENKKGQGLDLLGYEPAWKIDAPAMDKVREWLLPAISDTEDQFVCANCSNNFDVEDSIRDGQKGGDLICQSCFEAEYGSGLL